MSIQQRMLGLCNSFNSASPIFNVIKIMVLITLFYQGWRITTFSDVGELKTLIRICALQSIVTFLKYCGLGVVSGFAAVMRQTAATQHVQLGRAFTMSRRLPI